MALQRHVRSQFLAVLTFISVTLNLYFILGLMRVSRLQSTSYKDITQESRVDKQLLVVNRGSNDNLWKVATDRLTLEKQLANDGPFIYPKLSDQRDPNFDYLSAMEKLNKENVSMDDPRLIQLIRKYYIDPPSELPYNLTHPDRMDTSKGQVPYVDFRLHAKEGGFFVECGALDGERGSNSLFLERHRHWGGLMIEASPSNYQMLRSKHRKAYTINACLSTVPYPTMMPFRSAFNVGRIVKGTYDPSHKRANIDYIQCFPLYSLLLALNQTTVDFFSLDVEGDELEVLKTIPYDKVDIDFLAVEVVHQDGGGTEMMSFMSKQNYRIPLSISRVDERANDVILRKNRPNCTSLSPGCRWKFYFA